jgi:DNA-binding PadR family transcriptional regulator
MPLKRLKVKTTKEILWIYILKLLEKKEMYAYQIKSELQKNFGFEPALITPYVVLYRMESSGYVKGEKKDNKKYYKITPKGEALLREGIEHLKELTAKLSQ